MRCFLEFFLFKIKQMKIVYFSLILVLFFSYLLFIKLDSELARISFQTLFGIKWMLVVGTFVLILSILAKDYYSDYIILVYSKIKSKSKIFLMNFFTSFIFVFSVLIIISIVITYLNYSNGYLNFGINYFQLFLVILSTSLFLTSSVALVYILLKNVVLTNILLFGLIFFIPLRFSSANLKYLIPNSFDFAGFYSSILIKHTVYPFGGIVNLTLWGILLFVFAFFKYQKREI